MWYPPAPATASGSAPGKKSSPTTLYYCYNGKRAEATAGKWLLFLFFSSLGFRRDVRQVFRSDSGLVRPSGPCCFAVGRCCFCYFYSLLFSFGFRRDVRHFFRSDSRLVSKETFGTFRGHLAPVSSFTAMLFLLSRFCHGGNG